MTPTLQSTHPFDLISEPDDASRDLRDTLQRWSLAAGLLSPHERSLVLARELRETAHEALDLLQQLLLLRRALICLMQATDTEALCLPFTNTVLAAHVPLRVKHDPHTLPNVLQILLPGEGVIPITHDRTTPTPGAGWDSEGLDEAARYRAALAGMRQAILNDAGRDTLLALIDVTLRT
jgi:hypothetical protein